MLRIFFVALIILLMIVKNKIMHKYIIHTGPGIGDMMQFFSMARAIKKQNPDARVDFLMRGCKSFYKIDSELFECQDYADNLYWYASNAIIHNIKLIFQLVFNCYDYGFVRIGKITGSTSLWPYYIMRYSGCKTIVGYGTNKLDIVIPIPERTHYLKRNAMMLNAIGIKPYLNAKSLNVTKLDNTFVNSLPINKKKKIIALSVGTNSMIWKENGKVIVYDVKSWEYIRWIELAEKLVKAGFFVIIMGGPKEREEIKNKNVVLPSSSNIINLIGETTIKQSLAVLSRCHLVVGAEGGMMHSASALGIQTLTIIGGSDYKCWNPGGEDSPIVRIECDNYPCFGTRKAIECKKHFCLSKITVNNVFSHISRLIVE